MKKIIPLLIFALFLLETSCAYRPQRQPWQPKGYGPLPITKPRAYRR